ncbi:glucose-6-phosphate isomerase [Clostridiales bacterium COT073_COT-073]|nr:glucose-6-phosphate isomerase [Clostridiales bacterium COT073_COT-073]
MNAIFNVKDTNHDLRSRAREIWQAEENHNFYGPDYPAEHLEFLKARAEEIRSQCDVFFLVGVGGSNGAARAIIEGLSKNGTGGGPKIVYAGNGLSPRQMERLLQEVERHRVCLNVIAKNFQTLEPGSHFRMLRQAMEKKYGQQETARRIVVTGSKGSLLEEIAVAEGYTFLEFEPEVGGRFSAFSNVGLFPMAVAGIDISQLLAGRAEMLAEMKKENHFIYDYVAYRQAAYQQGYRVEVLSAFDLDFREWLKWWVQLFGESEGKDKKGLYPDGLCFSEDLHSMGQFLQDGSPIMIETFLRVKNYDHKIAVVPSRIKDEFDYLNDQNFAGINRVMEDATIAAHAEEGIPYFLLEIDDFSEKEWGRLFIFFMAAVVISGRILEVNPFNQEGVEKYKQKMFEGLRGKRNGK